MVWINSYIFIGLLCFFIIREFFLYRKEKQDAKSKSDLINSFLKENQEKFELFMKDKANGKK
jgi:preprotein translocase subunit YajC